MTKRFLMILALGLLWCNQPLMSADLDKEDLAILLIMNHGAEKPLIFTTDIDNNLIFQKNNYGVKTGKIKLNVCLLTNMKIGQEDEWNKNSILAIKEAGLLGVESIYQKYGIKNIAKIAALVVAKALEDDAAKENIKLKVETDCEDGVSGRYGRVKWHTTLYVIPIFLVPVIQNYGLLRITKQDAILGYGYDELKKLSDKYAEVKKENKNTKSKILESYKKYAENDSKEFMGSLIIALYGYDSSDRQRFCTLKYEGEDAISVIGYRLKGKEILVPGGFKDWYLNKGYLISYDKQNNYFDHTFSDINDAYLQIKNRREKGNLSSYQRFCNIFVDYPKNIMKLQTALQRDFGANPIPGMLFSKKELNNKFATYKGFESYDQYVFSIKIGANLNQIIKLQKENILNYEDYTSIQNEMMNLNYSNEKSLQVIINYLVDKKESEKKGISVLAYKKLREEAEKEQRKRENEEQLARTKELDNLKGAASLAAKHAAACRLKSTGNTRKLLDGHINYLYQLVQNSKLPGYGNEQMYRQIISASDTILKLGKCN